MELVKPLAKSVANALTGTTGLNLINPIVGYHKNHIVSVGFDVEGPEDIQDQVKRQIGFPVA